MTSPDRPGHTVLVLPASSVHPAPIAVSRGDGRAKPVDPIVSCLELQPQAPTTCSWSESHTLGHGTPWTSACLNPWALIQQPGQISQQRQLGRWPGAKDRSGELQSPSVTPHCVTADKEQLLSGPQFPVKSRRGLIVHRLLSTFGKSQLQITEAELLWFE